MSFPPPNPMESNRIKAQPHGVGDRIANGDVRDRKFCLEAVTDGKLVLRDVSEELWCDHEIVLAAVAGNGWYLNL